MKANANKERSEDGSRSCKNPLPNVRGASIKSKCLLGLLALLAFGIGASGAEPIGTAFTFKGRLLENGTKVSGTYDLKFTLYDDKTGGSPTGGPLSVTDVAVSDGLFTVTLDFGASVFTGDARWVKLEVKTNGASSYVTLSPRHSLQPSPHTQYAASAGTATSATTAATATTANGVSSGAVTAAGIASGNVVKSLNTLKDDVTLVAGANLTLIPSGQALTLSSPSDWHLGGNSGTTPDTQFIGTTDNQPLEFKVNADRVLRLELSAGSPNIIGGYKSNKVDATAWGATIGGGGSNGIVNLVQSSFGTIAGGANNIIQSSAEYSAIGGGGGNAVWAGSDHSTIAGGAGNSLQSGAINASIGGGAGNAIQSGDHQATIAGGSANLIEAGAHNSTIGGGQLNRVKANATYATVPGGLLNEAGGAYSFAAGHRAKANHGSFVWADSTDADFIHSGSDQFAVRAHGGVWLETGPAGVTMNGPLSGATLEADQLTGTLLDARLSPNVAMRNVPNTFTGNQTVNGGDILTRGPSPFQANGQQATLYLGDLSHYIRAEYGFGTTIGTWPVFDALFITEKGPGYVGIGTNYPAEKLEVAGGNLVVRGPSNFAPPAPGIDPTATVFVGDTNHSIQAVRGQGLSLSTWDGASALVVHDHGNVGIGTTDPQAKLEVNGNLRVQAIESTGSLDLYAKSERVLRLEPSTLDSSGYYYAPNVIVGWSNNTVIGAVGATIAGGGLHYAINGYDYPNTISADLSTIGGGAGNSVFPNASESTVAGGWANQIHAWESVIGGGVANRILPGANVATIAGGQSCWIGTNAEYGVIGGGCDNDIGSSLRRSWWAEQIERACTISGGLANFILEHCGSCTIGGGINNTIEGNAWFATISGGADNIAGSTSSTVAGGFGNTAAGQDSVVAGGYTNSASGLRSTVPGGYNNLAAGQYSFAAGQSARARTDGSFVWADSTPFPFDPFNTQGPQGVANSFNVRCTGGFYIVTGFDASGNPSVGQRLTPGSGSWDAYSDRNGKTNFAAVDSRDVLERVSRIPIESWNYKAQSASVRHIGPMAQDFHAAFGTGDSDKVISAVDADGVALAAIQGLNQKVKEDVGSLRAENEALKRELSELKDLVKSLVQNRTEARNEN